MLSNHVIINATVNKNIYLTFASMLDHQNVCKPSDVRKSCFYFAFVLQTGTVDKIPVLLLLYYILKIIMVPDV